MPSQRDNDEERLNRIAALMEEYRINHEDLVLYVKSVRSRIAAARTGATRHVRTAREGVERVRQNRRR